MLVEAVRQDDVTKVRSLIEEGADVNGRTTCGETSFGAAVDDDNFELVDVLLEAGADVNTAYPSHLQTGTTALPPLMVAIVSRKMFLTLRLLKAGADVNPVLEPNACLNISPLDASILNGWIHPTLLLLKAGADVNQVDFKEPCLGSDAISPLGLVLQEYMEEERRCNISAMLIDAGADVNANLLSRIRIFVSAPFTWLLLDAT